MYAVTTGLFRRMNESMDGSVPPSQPASEASRWQLVPPSILPFHRSVHLATSTCLAAAAASAAPCPFVYVFVFVSPSASALRSLVSFACDGTSSHPQN